MSLRVAVRAVNHPQLDLIHFSRSLPRGCGIGSIVALLDDSRPLCARSGCGRFSPTVLRHDMPSTQVLQEKARVIRQHIVRMTTAAGSGHPSSSMSATEIVTALYFGGFLRVNPQEPNWVDRDRFILSKGHACPVLYAAMAEIGYFPADDLITLRQLGSVLEGHPNYRRL